MANPIGIYIHIPFCKSKCDYCDFYSLAGQEEQMDRYQRALLTHLRQFAPQLKKRVADTIYFGGGTPSYYAGDPLPAPAPVYRQPPGRDHRGVQPRQRGLAFHGPAAPGGGQPHLPGGPVR